jgi:predicted glutamine amidotransferase
MCRESRTADGDRQGDGWGVAFWESGKWVTAKSLSPIWEDFSKLKKIPQTNSMIVHARSASFPNQKGNIEFNQPYVSGKSAFVFNGMLSGVKFRRKIEGKIGAQKIWTLAREIIQTENDEKAMLAKLRVLIREHSKTVRGLNVGLANPRSITALCDYSTDKEYFTLNYCDEEDLKIICSEKLNGYKWNSFKKGEVVSL